MLYDEPSLKFKAEMKHSIGLSSLLFSRQDRKSLIPWQSPNFL